MPRVRAHDLKGLRPFFILSIREDEPELERSSKLGDIELPVHMHF